MLVWYKDIVVNIKYHKFCDFIIKQITFVKIFLSSFKKIKFHNSHNQKVDFFSKKYFINKMNEFISEKQLFLEILSLKTKKNEINSELISNEIYESIKDLKFYRLSTFQLMSIKSQFSEQCATSYEILKKYNIEFPYRPFLLSSLIDNIKFKNESGYFLYKLILYSYLGWYLMFKETNKTEKLHILLNALNFISQPNDITDKDIDPRLTVSAFYHAFKLYIQSKNDDDLTQFLSPINDFFIFNKILPSCSFELIEFISIYMNSPNKKLSETFKSDFLMVVNNLTQMPNILIPIAIVSNILDRNIKLLQLFDKDALDLFIYISKNSKEMERIKEYLSILLFAIYENVHKSDALITIPKINNKVHKLDYKGSITVSYKFTDNNIFENKKIENIYHIPERIPICKLVSNQFNSLIKIIVSVVSKNECLIKHFISVSSEILLLSLKSEYCFDIYAIIFNIFMNVLPDFQTILIKTELLFNDVIFNPEITIFMDNKPPNFHEISSLRSYIFDFFLYDYGIQLKQIFFKAVNTPQLYAELVYRLFSCQIDYTNLDIVSSISLSLLDPLTYYQTITDKEMLDDIYYARSGILTYLDAILKSNVFLINFFSNSHFVKFFLSFIYEKPLRNFVLSKVKQYLLLLDKNPKYSTEAIDTLHFVLTSGVCSLSSPEQIDLLTNILQCLNNIFSKTTEILKSFISFVNSLCSNLNLLPEGNNTYIFLKEVIKFISYTSKIKPLEFSEIKLIESTIHRIYDNKIDEEITNNLVNLSITDGIITQPKALYLYIQPFFHSPRLINCFQYLSSLCNGNMKNCISIHEGEIDLLVLSYLEEWRTQECVDKGLILESLNFIQIVSSRICSFTVVQKYISLLCSIDEKFLPYNNMELIMALCSLIDKAKCIPQYSFPLTSETKIQIYSLNNIQEFSFAFWYLHEENNQNSLFDISDGYSSYSLNLKNNHFEFQFITQENQTSHEIPKIIEVGEWNFYAFVCENSEIKFYFNADLIESFTNNIQFKSQTLNCTVNKDAKSSDNSSLLSSFGMFGKLSNQEIEKLSMNGEFISDFTPIFTFIPRERNGLIEIHSMTNVKFDSTVSRVPYFLSFVEILLHFCKIEILLPLFSQLNLCYKNGTYPKNFIYLLTVVLSKSLLYNSTVQESFYSISGFLIISHLLKNANHQHFSYKLYKEFIKLFDKLEHEELRKQFFQSILSNFEIWIFCKPIDHLAYLKHLSKLGKKYPHYFNDFETLLFKMRLCYWYTPNDNGIYELIKRPKDLQISKCRSYMFIILTRILKYNYQDSNLIFLVHNIVTSQDLKQIYDMLCFLLKIIRLKIVKNQTGIEYLRFLFTFNKENITYKVIEIFSYFNDFMKKEVFQIILYYPIFFRNKRLFIKLCKLSRKVPELQHLCAWFANKMSINYIKKMIKLNPNNSSNEKDIWTIALLFNLPEKIKIKVIRYLIQSRKENLAQLHYLIEMVGKALDVDAFETFDLFFIELCNCINKDNIDTIDSLVRHYILFHTGCSNLALKDEFKNSQFNLNEQEESQELPSNFAKLNLYQKINILSKKKPKYHFSLCISKDKKWIHLNLVKKIIINLIDKSETDTPMILCGIFFKLGFFIPDIIFSKFVSKYYSNIFFNSLTTKNQIENALNFTSFIDEIQDTIQEKEEYYFDIKQNSFEEISMPARSPLLIYIEKKKENEQNNSQLWSHLWRSMTISRAPWNSSLSVERRRKTYFKRDNTFCSYFLPIKLRINFSFNLHSSASIPNLSMLDSKEENNEQQENSLIESEEIIVKDELSNNNCKEFCEKTFYESRCEHITIKKSYSSIFRFYSDNIQIVHENGRTKKFFLKDLIHVFMRTKFHRYTSLEFFTNERQSYLIDFLDNDNMNNILGQLKRFLPSKIIQTVSFRQYFSQQSFTNDWVRGKISNFEYLMLLNIYSGRSFNSPSQYPVFPWIIKDYNSSILDLSNPNSFRDLSLPIGAQDPKTFETLKKKQLALEQAGVDSYLYSCGPICPLSLYSWLIRLEPFTSLHIQIQGGRFDHTARIFSSIPHSYKLSNSTNSFRELIPEFFCSPEFLTNDNGFNLGICNEHSISEVVLPNWASSPIDFIYLHRKAIESDYVSDDLNQWIDLIWGNKQRSSNNLYPNDMYEDIWNEKSNLKNSEVRKTIEDKLSQIGQIPPQLFKTPHPKRMKLYNFESFNTKQEVTFNIGFTDIITSNVSLNDNHKINIISICKNGVLVRFTIKVGHISKVIFGSNTIKKRNRAKTFDSEKSFFSNINDNIIHDTDEPKLINYPINSFNLIKKSSFYVPCDSCFYVVGNNKNELYSIKSDTCQINCELTTFGDIMNISCDGIYKIISSKNSVIYVYKNDFKHLIHSIPSFCDSINCSSVSNEFDLLVCGTKDKYLLLCSLSQGSVVHIIQLKGSPMLTLITPSWGFVLVYQELFQDNKLNHFISLYTINGKEIRDVRINFSITNWITYKDKKGFDFIIIYDEKGRIYCSEAFYLNIEKPFFRCTGSIISLSYYQDISLVIAVTREGKIYFIPYDHEKQ